MMLLLATAQEGWVVTAGSEVGRDPAIFRQCSPNLGKHLNSNRVLPPGRTKPKPVMTYGAVWVR